MLEIPISSNAAAILQQLQGFTLRMQKGIAGAMDRQNQLTIAHAQRHYLTGPRPVRLGVRSNRLRSSLNAAPARVSENEVVSAIGTNVKYAGVHEHGFLDFVTVRQHKRNVFREHGTKGGLVFDMKTGRIKKEAKRKISLLQGQATVRSHLRFMNMPARPFLQPALNDSQLSYGQAISRAIEKAWGGGQS